MRRGADEARTGFFQRVQNRRLSNDMVVVDSDSEALTRPLGEDASALSDFE